MLLSGRVLSDVANVNSFHYANSAELTAGDAVTIYIQLVDASLDKSLAGFNPPGRRYMPASGSTLTVTLESIDDDKKVALVASQPFAQDPSIWSVSLLSSQTQNAGTANLTLSLNQGGAITRGTIKNACKIYCIQ